MAKKSIDKALASLFAAIPDSVSIERYEQHDHTIELFINWPEPGRGERHCPKCGSARCVKKDGGAMQTVRHVRTGVFGTLITFHKPRLVCKDCKCSFFLKPDWIMSDMSITNHLLLEVFTQLTSTTDCIEQIASNTDTTPAIVRNVMYHINLGKPKSLPRTLGIDEFHGQTGTYNPDRKKYDTEKYHCVITDAEEGYVHDVLYKATYRELHDYFMEYPLILRQHVKYFCTDMRGGFSKVARACFPNAKICIDPFHVVKLLTDAINDMRIAQWHKLTDKANKLSTLASAARETGDEAYANQKSMEAKEAMDNAKLIKGSQKILTTSPFNLDAYWTRNSTKRDTRLKEIYQLAPDLETARDALVAFYSIMHTDTYAIRRTELTAWIDKYISCEIAEIRKAAGSIQKHRTGIENAWRYNKSNGPTEGQNKRIKDVRRLGFGAHDFENFRRRVLLACGPTTIKNCRYTIFGEKNPYSVSAPSTTSTTENKEVLYHE